MNVVVIRLSDWTAHSKFVSPIGPPLKGGKLLWVVDNRSPDEGAPALHDEKQISAEHEAHEDARCPYDQEAAEYDSGRLSNAKLHQRHSITRTVDIGI